MVRGSGGGGAVGAPGHERVRRGVSCGSARGRRARHRQYRESPGGHSASMDDVPPIPGKPGVVAGIRHEMPCLAVRRPVASGARPALCCYVEAPSAAPAAPPGGSPSGTPPRRAARLPPPTR
ncbi:hypothetical protein KPATCC21470_3362 [Kitasatospora purpeofusca]